MKPPFLAAMLVLAACGGRIADPDETRTSVTGQLSSSDPGYLECYGAAACIGDARESVAHCVAFWPYDPGPPGAFADCCTQCTDPAWSVSCEAHCGGWQECCPSGPSLPATPAK